MNKQKLEKKFQKVHEEVIVKINQHVENARRELDLAVKLSEEFGIPFTSDVVEMEKDRAYLPKTFSKKWKGLDYSDILEGLDIWIGETEDTDGGWEYWQTSSLTNF